MAWQPPPPPQRPGGNGSPPQGQGPGGGGGGHGSGHGSGAQPPQQDGQSMADLSFYELLQVDRDAHPTIIRYAYRFLAAMYHPDNGETGSAEKFRIISEAWRTLSDEGKRAAYDMSLGVKEAAKAGGAGGGHSVQKQASASPKPGFSRDGLPNVPKTTLTWNEIELRLAILQVLLAARRQRPATGGASGKMLMDCLNIDAVTEIEFALWYLREKGNIEMGERAFMITAQGVDYLTEQLSRTEVLGGPGAMEKKTRQMVKEGTAGLPAPTRPPSMGR